MKNNLQFSRFAFLFISLFSISQLRAVQIWSGVDGATSVTDDDITIAADTSFPAGPTTVSALTTDVEIDVQGDFALFGSSDGPSQFYLYVEEDREIVFKIRNDLDITGSPVDGNNPASLLIVQSGRGKVRFKIEGGQELSFKSGLSSIAQESSGKTLGVEYWVLMEECSEYEDTPTLQFKRDGGDKDDHAKIKIGKDSLLSYLSPNPVGESEDCACIEFDPTNKGDGRLVLDVANKGAFIVRGSKTRVEDGLAITLDDIVRRKAAGENALWKIKNRKSTTKSGNGYYAGLLVVSDNNTLFDLLVDPFCNLEARNDLDDYNGSFSGIQYGVVLGANGTLNILSDAYLDYVGLSLNKAPNIDSVPGFEGIDPDQLLKLRNPSALFVDGNLNPNATPAKLIMNDRAAAFFRSGVANDGSVRDVDDYNPFTVDSLLKTPGMGNLVLDVEGQFDVHGPLTDGKDLCKIELLSLEVCPSGGPLFSDGAETNFPSRTFEKEDGEYVQYNCGAFLINNEMNLYDTSLMHTDECHEVYSKNDVKSEPAYVGGETHVLKEDLGVARPRIVFYNSCVRVHSDVAATGLDLVESNLVDDGGICKDNQSQFIFYHNGPSVDNGTGRQMVLGTKVGSTAADGCTLVSCDAHLDIMQLDDCIDAAFSAAENHVLRFKTAPNTTHIVETLGDTSKNSVHTIYLGCDSNISIGVNAVNTGYKIETNPCLSIEGNFFSFETRGGPLRSPETSSVTGKGGMFVDYNGKVSIGEDYRASIAMMITKSRNGVINLPKTQVFFDNRIGIADWRLDLSDPSVREIISQDMCLSDYTLNWMTIDKDYTNFCPYELGDVTICECPEVTAANVASLPQISGRVHQFQIQASRIGDTAHIVVDGGQIDELIFPLTEPCVSGEAPVAVVVLNGDSSVGIGSYETSEDSLSAATTLGVNGVTIIQNGGDNRIYLNSDVVINNICSILKGPDAKDGVLEITSKTPKELRIRPTGILDLRSFDNSNDVVRIAGQVSVVAEPGATIITGAGTLQFAENAKFVLERAADLASKFNISFGPENDLLDPNAVVDASLEHNSFAALTNVGDDLRNTDDIRVTLAGEGSIDFRDDSQGIVPLGTVLAVETIKRGDCELFTTDLTICLKENADFFVGSQNHISGGVLQVGNVEDFGNDHNVSFTLCTDGTDAAFEVGGLGELLLGAGAVTIPLTDEDTLASAYIAKTYNVNKITIQNIDGLIRHDRIYDTTSSNGSILVLSDDVTYDLTFEEVGADLNATSEERTSNANISGGGNLILLKQSHGSAIKATVGTDDNEVVVDDEGTVSDFRCVGMMASTALLDMDENEVGLTGTEMFGELKTQNSLDIATPALNKANAATKGESFRAARTGIRGGTVVNDFIIRDDIFDIYGTSGTAANRRQEAVEKGAVFVRTSATEIILATALG